MGKEKESYKVVPRGFSAAVVV